MSRAKRNRDKRIKIFMKYNYVWVLGKGKNFVKCLELISEFYL